MVQQRTTSWTGLKFLALIPAIALVFTRLWPILTGLVASLKNVDIMRGLWEAEWVGLQKFERLFSNPYFFSALGTTAAYGAALLIAGTLLAFLSALIFRKLRSPILRGVLLSGALLLSFLPEQLLLETALGIGMSPVTELFELGYIISGIISQVGLAVLLGAAGALLTENSGRPVLRFSGAFLYLFLRLAQLFSGSLASFELSRRKVMGGSLFFMTYQSGLQRGEVGEASAISVVVNLLQLLPVIAAVLVLLLALHRGNAAPGQISAGKTKAPTVIVLCALCALFVLGAAVYVIMGGSTDRDGLPGAVLISLVHVFIGAVVFSVFALPGAAASAASRRPFVTALFLIFTGLAPGMVMDYDMGRRLALMNSVIGPPLFAALSLLPLAAVISYFFHLNRRRALVFALPVLGLALQGILTNVLYPLLFISNTGMQSLPFISHLVLTKYPVGGISVSGSTLVLTLISLAIWALSCIPLFRRTDGVPQEQPLSQPQIPAAQFQRAGPVNASDPFAPLNRKP